MTIIMAKKSIDYLIQEGSFDNGLVDENIKLVRYVDRIHTDTFVSIFETKEQIMEQVINKSQHFLSGFVIWVACIVLIGALIGYHNSLQNDDSSSSYADQVRANSHGEFGFVYIMSDTSSLAPYDEMQHV